VEQTLSSNRALTNDTLFDGRLHCHQPKDGYRFSVDAVLAAHFLSPKPNQRVLDLGCGCGVIGLILAYRYADIEITGLEIQDDLAALAEENGRCNNFGDRFQVLRGDVRTIAESLPPESFDLIICNPPYRGRATGRINRDDQAAAARHELHGELGDFIRGAAFAVKNRGRVIVVYPARRSTTLLATLQAQRLAPKRLQPVYAYPDAEQACLVLVEARKNGGEQVEILAPFYLYGRKNGGYTPALQAMYQEVSCSPR
jgi:tRNA1Val (adenine37-N6)-methyltransferase